MPTRITPSAGGKPDKLIRDALMIAVKREHVGEDGQKTNKLNAIATKLVECALEGKMDAIKEIGDRLDGRPVQGIEATTTVTHEHKIDEKALESLLDKVGFDEFTTFATMLGAVVSKASNASGAAH